MPFHPYGPVQDQVTCDMPFTVVGKSDSSIDEWWEDGNTLWLNFK